MFGMNSLPIKNRNSLYSRGISLFVAIAFAFSAIIPASSAQSIATLNLPVPGAMVMQSPAFAPVLLKGMIIHPEDPFRFDFIVDSGNTDFNPDEIKKESEKLVKYFLAAMTIPKDHLWVNLSPYERDRIIPDELGKTELGRDMLAQDYILKQLTASLMYPEDEIGNKFWDRIYKKSQEQFGTSEIPVNTFNKVWIIPESATVYENDKTVCVVESRLKVLLEEDYLALQNNEGNAEIGTDQLSEIQIQSASSISSQIVREIILPEIEKEVNEGENFASLRQIYHSLILAKWYKETIRNSLLSKIYIDQKKTAGVELDNQVIKEQIYDQYMKAYKKGVFDFIKEDYDQLSQEVIPRKYFSGGLEFEVNIRFKKASSSRNFDAAMVGGVFTLGIHLNQVDSSSSSPILNSPHDDQAMLTDFLAINHIDTLNAENRQSLKTFSETSGIKGAHFLNVERFRQDHIEDGEGERDVIFLARSFGKIRDDPDAAKQHNSTKNGFIIEGDIHKVEEFLINLNILEKAHDKGITLNEKTITISDTVILKIFTVENEYVTYEQMVKIFFNRSHASTKIVEHISGGVWQRELQDVVELINSDEPSIAKLKEFAASTHFWVRIAAMSRLVDYDIESLKLRDTDPEDVETKSFLLGYKAIAAKSKKENPNWKGKDAELLVKKAREWEEEDKKRIYEEASKIAGANFNIKLHQIKTAVENIRVERVSERSKWIPDIEGVKRPDRDADGLDNKVKVEDPRYFPIARWLKRYPKIEEGPYGEKVTKMRVVKQSTQLAPYILLWQWAYDIAKFKQNLIKKDGETKKDYLEVLGDLIDKEELDSLKERVENGLQEKKVLDGHFTARKLGELLVGVSHSKFNQSEVVKIGGLLVGADGGILSVGYNGEPLKQGSDMSVTFTDLRKDDYMLNRQVNPETHGFYAPGLFEEAISLDLRDNRPDLRRSICGEQKAILHAIINGVSPEDLRKATAYTTYDPCNQCAEHLANTVKDVCMLAKFTDPQTVRIFMQLFGETKEGIEQAIKEKEIVFLDAQGKTNQDVNYKNPDVVGLDFDLNERGRVNDASAFKIAIDSQVKKDMQVTTDLIDIVMGNKKTTVLDSRVIFNQLIPQLKADKSTDGPILPDVGGIDLNEINVDRQDSGIDIQFDPAMMQDILNNGVDGFVPVIINLTPINSIMPLLGLEPRNREEKYEVSALN